jgi:hypothetical protein
MDIQQKIYANLIRMKELNQQIKEVNITKIKALAIEQSDLTLTTLVLISQEVFKNES